MKFLMPLFLMVVAFLGTGCEKSVEDFTSGPKSSDTLWAGTNSSSLMINQLHQVLGPSLSSDSFTIAQGLNLQTPAGRIHIPANAVGFNSTTATGKALLEYKIITSKGDLVRSRYTSAFNRNLLENIGTVYLNLTKNNEPLTLLNNQKITVSFPQSQLSAPVHGFYAEQPAASGFSVNNWNLNSNVSSFWDSGFYKLVTGKTGWVSSQRILDTSTAKSRSVVSMPATFTNANTSVFMIFKNKHTVLQLMPQTGNRIWLVENVPLGEPVIYLTISRKLNTFFMGVVENTTSFRQNIHITPAVNTLAAMNSYLDAL